MTERLKNIREEIIKKVFIRGEKIEILDDVGLLQNWIFDFRKSLLDPSFLSNVSREILSIIQKNFPSPRILVGGLESAGIPLVSGVVLSSLENSPPCTGFYIRKSRKKAGLLNLIEGDLSANAPVFISSA